jgi:hypothetical protein
MSFEITTSFVKQYHRNVFHLVQQKGSRFRSLVREEPIEGEEDFFDSIGQVSAVRIVDRHGDSPIISTPHGRRRVVTSAYDWGDLVDKMDKIRMLNDPTSDYAQAGSWAMARSMDDIILESFFSSAWTGKSGTTETVFDTNNVIAVGGTGLTIDKLIQAKEILDSYDNDPDEARYIGVTAKQVTNLLKTTEITNADYNTVKALVSGQINSFMGFEFVRSQRIPVDGSAYRRLPCWIKSGMLLAIGQNPVARITERADKRFSVYVYVSMDLGATRMEEEKVVEIKCSET